MVGSKTEPAPRAAITGKRVDAIVVGAGFGGLYAIHKLRELGFTAQGIEAADDVGGTWYWNRYPGARCDIPSLMYSYTFSEKLLDEWRWSEKYATQPEILAYANYVAERFDLKKDFLFETRVETAAFDETSNTWKVATNRGDTFEAPFFIMATGCLSVPRDIDIPGAERFKGEAYSTSRWPHENVNFKGKRVAMIGTGSSAIQSTPLIAAEAKSVTVFQRTPNYSLPALNCPLSDEEVANWKAGFPMYRQMLLEGNLGVPQPPPDWVPSKEELDMLSEGLWGGGGLTALTVFPNLVRDEKINAVAAEYVRKKIREIVKDPKTAEKLTPRDYPLGAKRACVDTDYYATFNRDNVSLVDLRETPIETITEKGVKTTDQERQFDVIVYAIGFDAMTGALLKVDIKGAGGKPLRDAWKEGPKTYLGVSVAGFPNFFMVTGPGSPSVLSNMITSCEQHVDWISAAMRYMRDKKKARIEATPGAQEAWVQHVNEEADATLFPKANSWYIGANVPGKPRVFMPYVGEGYRVRADEIARKGYEGFAVS